uniref:Non-haem dioxygenase N-terminal domain-containing protein n=1 Tax=Romanomermis culicivorax TaxID=13658 RepID=A0A915JSQ5_ROMCU
MEKFTSLVHDEIPVISLNSVVGNGNPDRADWQRLADHIDRALSTFTCFFIIDHGIGDELCAKVLQDLSTFFEKPVNKKLIYELKNK